MDVVVIMLLVGFMVKVFLLVIKNVRFEFILLLVLLVLICIINVFFGMFFSKVRLFVELFLIIGVLLFIFWMLIIIDVLVLRGGILWFLVCIVKFNWCSVLKLRDNKIVILLFELFMLNIFWFFEIIEYDKREFSFWLLLFVWIDIKNFLGGLFLFNFVM